MLPQKLHLEIKNLEKNFEKKSSCKETLHPLERQKVFKNVLYIWKILNYMVPTDSPDFNKTHKIKYNLMNFHHDIGASSFLT